MKTILLVISVLLCVAWLCGCELFEPQIITYTTTTTETVNDTETEPKITVTYSFVDEQQNQYEINANPNVPTCAYKRCGLFCDKWGVQEKHALKLGILQGNDLIKSGILL